MRLKHLQLLGYKTFATKTEFLFPSGITAIVGPNGSGKSNIADALRWVMGEQSYSTLRGKRTEDMIFSGSQSRARSGMAEVILTLDNSDGWLPLDFSEITVSRRAFRDGQNEYRINNSRVRYRDVLELLSQGGLGRRNYTIVGQGLVDAVLSLRASERRELFEEAAGIAHYRDKRTDALNKLAETQRNLERVHDIMSEIEPRLRRLKRQAERTKEYDDLAGNLERLLRMWYGHRWGVGIKALDDAQASLDEHTQQYEACSRGLQALTDEIDQVRQDQADLRQQLSDWHRQNSALHAEAEASQRELAVLEERRLQITKHRDANLGDIATLTARVRAQHERVDDARAQLDDLTSRLALRDNELQLAQADLDAHLSERAKLEDKRTQVADTLAELRAHLVEHESHVNSLRERANGLEDRLGESRFESERLAQQLNGFGSQRGRVEVQLDRLAGELTREHEKIVRVESHLRATEQRLDEETRLLHQVREAEADTEARLDLLGRLRAEFALYGDAAKALLTKAKNKEPGVFGVLAQMITTSTTSSDLNQAIDAALGVWASAVVVDRWETAKRALQLLRTEDVSGPVVLLAADDAVGRPNADHAQGEAWVPLSSHVVCDDWLKPLIDRLLGDTYLVPDLDTGRSAFQQLPSGGTCVTRDGAILRNDWSVEVRSAIEQTSPLSQEREWATLNARRIEVGAEREARASAVAATEEAAASLEATRAQISQKIDEINIKHAAAKAVSEKLNAQIDRLESEIAWRKAQIDSAEAERKDIQQKQTELLRQIDDLHESHTSTESELAEVNQQIRSLLTDEYREQLVAAQMAMATSRQVRQSQLEILEELESGLAQLEAEKTARAFQVEQLQADEANVVARSSENAEAEARVMARLSETNERIMPAEARLEVLAEKQKEIESRERVERVRLREFENRYAAARLETQRREEDLAQLRRRIEADLGLVELDLGPKLSGQTPLPLHPLVSRLPTVSQLPDGLEEELSRLRAQIRRLGPVNPSAPEEYKETVERYDFLQEQSGDLLEASESLHKIIAELDGLIEHAFRQTFEAVAAEFAVTFKSLFGGGHARLELSEPDDLSKTGVDIVAQPPGKRLQTLASLSGGERALTAVALIFSVLKVSPIPFCILDEVDAMLDEANVGRFRSLLESLSEFTQTVIITHNRGTVLSADTVYGVSMGGDSVSQVYSIRLDGERIRDA